MSESPLLTQSLIDHLEALRRCVVVSCLAIVVGAILCYIKSDMLLALLIKPLIDQGPHVLHFFSPYDAFMVHVKISVGGGIVVAFPVVAWQLWRFVAPALFAHERNKILVLILFFWVLFLSGAALAYFFAIPWGLQFFLSYETPTLQALLSANEYISFVVLLLLAFGVVFLLPLALVGLGALGLLSANTLARYRKIAIVIILVVAAVLTPPDVVTQVMLAIPMYVLYEASILIMRFFSKNDRM